MNRHRTLLIVTALTTVALAWPFWTWGMVCVGITTTVFDGLVTLLYGDGDSCGYRFFLFRKILLLAVLSALFLSMWWLVATTYRTPSQRKLTAAFLAVVLSGQCVGFTLFVAYPESFLYNLVMYEGFPDNHKPHGFSVRKFFTIRKGVTTRNEVIALLGRGRPGTTIPEAKDMMWWYTGDWSTTGWWFRVHFDENDLVEELDSFYWWD